MNIFLSGVLVLFGTAVGVYFSYRLKERERIMSAAELLIKELEVRIRYTNSEIVKILAEAANNEAYEKLAFIACFKSADEIENFHGIWNDGVKGQPFITPHDKELLTALGDRLGETDCGGQLSFLEMTGEMIRAQREQAAADYSGKGKMYKSVGVLCGLAVGIMVL